MSIRPHAQQNQIKAGKVACVQREKLPHSLLRSLRRRHRILLLCWDWKAVSWWNGNLRQQRFPRHAVVAVRIVRGNMTLIAPEKEHLSPGQGSVGVRRNQSVQVLGRRSARQGNGEAPALRYRVGCTPYDFLGRRLKKILRRGEPAQIDGRTHNAPARPLLVLAAAHRAAPSRPDLSSVITCTGILSRSGRNRPFSRKARINSGPVSLGRILGEIPPLRKIPPVAMVLRARLPASPP